MTVMTLTPLLSSEQIEDLVAKILAARQRTVASIIETGSELYKLKIGTNHGMWTPLMARLKMSLATAEAYIAIARNPALAKSEHAQSLPASSDTLRKLSRIPAERLEKLIADKTVHSGLQRGDAKALVHREMSLKRIRSNKRRLSERELLQQRLRAQARAKQREAFRNSLRANHDAGQVHDILRDIEAIYRDIEALTEKLDLLSYELQERTKEIRGDRFNRDCVREFADLNHEIADRHQRITDRLLAIVDDDPGAVLGTSYEAREVA
jgi:hypothetical protein